MEDMEFPDNMDDFVTLDELDNTAGDSLGRNCSLSIYNCVCVWIIVFVDYYYY